MKKLVFLAAAAAALLVVSCQKNVSADLKEDVDSLTYELGVAQADGLKQYMTFQLGVDSTQLDEFLRGVQEGALNEPSAKEDAYRKGLEVGKQVQQMIKGLTQEVYGNDSTKTLNVNNLLAGLIDGLKGTASMSTQEAMESFEARLAPIKEQNLLNEFGENKKAGEEYLAKNAKAEGVTTLASGVQYKVIEAGKGVLPTDSSKVEVKYEGKLIDGTVFDSNLDREQPFVVDLKAPHVIPGWVEVLKIMPLGAKWEVTIPQEQAYGKQNMGQIKPFSTLIFTIERQK